MSRKPRESGRTPVRDAVRQLQERLPASWTLTVTEEARLKDFRADVMLTVRPPDGKAASVVVEAKSDGSPVTVRRTIPQLATLLAGSEADAAIFVAPYLPPRSREFLTEAGLGYADATGNIRLSIDQPALFIQAQGADKDPAPIDRPLMSLRGRAAGRVVRALLDFRPPYTLSELALRSDTPIASVFRVVDLLQREALVEREDRGPITEVAWQDLLGRWTQDYAFLTSNATKALLAPRGVTEVMAALGEVRFDCVITGGMAAAPKVAPERLLALYVDDAEVAARELGLRETEAGANVILAEPFDIVAMERYRTIDSLWFAAPTQVVADLMTGPGRWPQQAEAMLGWMQENEDAWRA
jgi:hypothetical protein